MENRKRALSTTLLLVFGLFGGLLLYTSQDRAVDPSTLHTTIHYGMDLELKWIAEADQADFVAVQETLSYYAGLLGREAGTYSSHFRLNHCCDEPVSLALGTASDFYQATASLDFPGDHDGFLLLRALATRGYLQTGKMTSYLGTYQGQASLHLPIPGQVAQVLHIRNSAFEVNLVPRFARLDEAMPEA